MASPALAALASRRARVLLRARVSTPSVALQDIVEGGVCASLCVKAYVQSVRNRAKTSFTKMRQAGQKTHAVFFIRPSLPRHTPQTRRPPRP